MDAGKLWEQVKEEFQLHIENNEPYSFDGVMAILFSETDRTLTLQAKDASEALYLNVQFGDPLITALESIIGSPAFIKCIYNPQAPKSNPRFTVHRVQEK